LGEASIFLVITTSTIIFNYLVLVLLVLYWFISTSIFAIFNYLKISSIRLFISTFLILSIFSILFSLIYLLVHFFVNGLRFNGLGFHLLRCSFLFLRSLNFNCYLLTSLFW
jgi:hypothetical protein